MPSVADGEGRTNRSVGGRFGYGETKAVAASKAAVVVEDATVDEFAQSGAGRTHSPCRQARRETPRTPPTMPGGPATTPTVMPISMPDRLPVAPPIQPPTVPMRPAVLRARLRVVIREELQLGQFGLIDFPSCNSI